MGGHHSKTEDNTKVHSSMFQRHKSSKASTANPEDNTKISKAKTSTLASPFRQALITIHKHPTDDPQIETAISKRYSGLATNAIGEGATSQTRVVTHKTSRRKFACKSVRLLQVPEMAKKQLLEEINIIRSLDHPHIIQVFEVFQQVDYLHIVMELCAGGELYDKLMTYPNCRMPEAHVKPLVVQMLSAINYMHQNGMVHRDLKLENFLLHNTRGGKQVVKLIDFGYSSEIQQGTALTMLCGTPYYMAPEVVNQKYGNMSDMWSLGVIVYMMVTGEAPIAGATNSDTLRHIKRIGNSPRDFGFLAGRIPGHTISKECQDFISSLMEVDVTKRFSATQAMAHPFCKKKFGGLGLKRNNKNKVFPDKKIDVSIPTLEAKTIDVSAHGDSTALKLNKFRQLNEYSRAAVKVTAFFSQGDTNLDELRQLFLEIDHNKDGTVSYSEFHEFLSKYLKKGNRTVDIEETFKAISGGPNLQIKYSDFITACQSEQVTLKRENVVNAFRSLDLDGDGFITKEELKAKLSGDDDVYLDDFFEHVDVLTKDGQIDLNEFIHLMKGDALTKK